MNKDLGLRANHNIRVTRSGRGPIRVRYVPCRTVIVEGDFIVCPECGAKDSIVNVDVSVRRNELWVAGDDEGCFSAKEGATNHRDNRFECQVCERRVAMPEGSECTYC
ncbi:hypothetical protein [Nonomuraea sp. KM90]|uniref:hypothetical protein n=1 Tax=Nonomuraea sp. KM90 TaxID=3457428 RepID=UPI003FCE5FB1